MRDAVGDSDAARDTDGATDAEGGAALLRTRGGRPPARDAAGRTRVALLLATALLALPGGLGAQAAPDSAEADTLPRPAFEGEPVTVTVTREEAELQRLPFTVSALDGEEVRLGERHLSLEETLASVPGVSVQNRRNHALGDRVTVRGVGARAQFGVRGLRMLVDGIPLTMPDGQSAVSNVDAASLGRVEVIRGPASALYGNGAGGVIRFRTREPADAALRVEPRVAAGSHGYLQTRLQASGRPGGEGGAGYVLSAGRMETDGFRDHARAEMYRGNLVVRARPAPDTRVRGVVNAYDMPFAQNPSSLTRQDARQQPRKARSFIVDQGAGKELRQVQGGATLDHRWGEGGGLEATAWGTRREVWNPIPTQVIDLDRAAGGLRTEVRGSERLAGLPARWTAGVDASAQRDRRRESENEGLAEDGSRAREGELLIDQVERVLAAGPFARLTVEPSAAWRLTATARYDAYRFEADDRFLSDGDDSGDRSLDQWSPAVGVSYAPAPDLTLYANASTAFETPTAQELSNRPSGEGGFHPELGPERLRTLEVGTKGERAGLRWQLSGYLSEVEDALVPVERVTGEVYFRNAGRVERKGLEASLAWRPAPGYRVRLAYTLQDNVFDRFETPDGDFSGNAEPGVPDHQLFAGGAYRTPFGLRAGVDVRWVDEFPVDDANSALNWSYEVVDLRLRWEGAPGGGPRIRPFAGVDNLFDVRYNGSVVPNAFGDRFYEPAPGREVFVGLSLGGG